MHADRINHDARAIESLLAFWSLAGVDTCYTETTVDRTVRLTPVKPDRPLPPQQQARSTVVENVGQDTIDEARRLASGAANLDSLAEAIASFEGCPLKTSGARQSVFSRGAPDAPVLLIGEAPGADEDLQGQPFVGRAGKLLDKMLEAAGLSGRVFITNTVFWRPPGNRTPTLLEQQICAPFLERAIELVAPRMLLLAGGASAKAVLGLTEGILSVRGRWFEWRSRDETLALPALPTLHPAFLLRQPGAKKKAWEDFLTLTSRLDQPD